MRTSLCSYTYNDQSMLHELLQTIPSWPTLPDEIVLVDDGSDEPFELTAEERKLPVRLLRPEANTGFRAAKQLGMSSARGDILVSLDCDSRLSGDFLDHAAALLADPGVGLVGPVDRGPAGRDLLSVYLSVFSSSKPPESDDTTNFVNGPAFALRRADWEKIGGLSGLDSNIGEDHYLSNTLRGLGYKLMIDSGSSVRSARVLTRLTFCRRTWIWCNQSWLGEISSNQTLPDYLKVMLIQARLRVSLIVDKYPPVWCYFELLQFTYHYLEFCNALGGQGRIPAQAGTDLLEVLKKRLGRFPSLYRLLKTDLMRAGALPLKPAIPPAAGDESLLAAQCQWKLLDEVLGELEENLILEYLEKIGIKELLDDEAEAQASFSSY